VLTAQLPDFEEVVFKQFNLYQNTKLALKTGNVSFTAERRKIPSMQSFNNN